MNVIPAKIRKRREDLGLSQAAAAALLGMNRKTWIRWEAGTVPMHVGYMLAFLLNAGVTVDKSTLKDLTTPGDADE